MLAADIYGFDHWLFTPNSLDQYFLSLKRMDLHPTPSIRFSTSVQLASNFLISLVRTSESNTLSPVRGLFYMLEWSPTDITKSSSL